MAFRLKPEKKGNNRVSYKNSLQNLKIQLNQLSKDKKIDFQPGQLQYIMGLLAAGLSKMENKQNIYFPGNNRRRNEILSPIGSSSNIYRLTYPETRQRQSYLPYYFRGLKRKKKNIVKSDKKTKTKKKSNHKASCVKRKRVAKKSGKKI